MSTDHQGEVRHHRKNDTAKRIEGYIQVAMVIAVAVLAVGLIWGVVHTGSSTPAWMH